MLALGNQSTLEVIEAPRNLPHRLACFLDRSQSAGEDDVAHLHKSVRMCRLCIWHELSMSISTAHVQEGAAA